MTKRQMMLDTGANNGWTILDYLDEDCWRAVLSYVPARDVMRTERASRRWQEVVLCYLRGVHISITVEHIRRNNKTSFNTCTLDSSKYKSFEAWTSKLGSSVVSTYCESWESLETIRENCPNLETLRFFKLPDCAPELFPHNLKEDFKNLKRLSFTQCDVSDHCIIQLIADKALEELVLNYCNELTGQFLNSMNLSNLKSLVIKKGYKLSEQHILSAVGRLGELTRLKLHYVNQGIAEEIQYVLDKMPKLEQLEIVDERIGCQSFEPLSRLTRLKHLNVSIQLGDDGVLAVASCCKELRTLVVDCEGMTSDGAAALGRIGARLTSLTLVGFFELDDDGLVAIIGGCPELEWLDVSGASFLTPALPARARAAWRAARPAPARRLKVDLSYTNLEQDEFLVSDYCISQFIGDKALTELKFTDCHGVTGGCLTAINTSNLKTLNFGKCRGLGFQMLSAFERLGELTALTIIDTVPDLAEEVQLVLDMMPKLELLEIYCFESMSDLSTEPLCRLTRLQHLSVSFSMYDEDLEAVTQSCKELRTLELYNCRQMSLNGVFALAERGLRLTSLALWSIQELTDDGVVAIIRGYPELTLLDVGGAGSLTPDVLESAREAWRELRPGRRLEIVLRESNLDHGTDALDRYIGMDYYVMKEQLDIIKTKYENMVIVFDSEESLNECGDTGFDMDSNN